MWITTNCGKFLKRREYQTAWPASWEICMQVKKQQLELDVEQQTGKGVQGCILPLCLFNLYAECIMWNAGLDEAQDGVKIAGRNINNLKYADNTTLMAERGTKEPLDEGERGEWKSWLKTQFSGDLGWVLSILWAHEHFQISNWQIPRKYTLFFGLQNHCRWWLQPWN